MKLSVKKIVCVSLLLPLCFTSCRKESEVSDLVNPNGGKCRTYLQQFESVWNGMSQGYVFWGRDTVDWDERYERFRPVFEEFDSRPASNPVTAAEYQKAYTGLFEGLLDHHLMGEFCVPRGKFEAVVSPGRNDYEHSSWSGYERSKQLEVLQKRPDLVPGSYAGYDPVDYDDDVRIPGTYFALLRLSESKMVAYFRFTNFHLMDIYTYHSILPGGNESCQEALRRFYGPRYWEGMTDIAGYANNDSVSALIIDLRGNSGGNTSDLVPFIGSLAQSPTLVGYTRVKDGFGRLDYSPWSEYVIDCPRLHLKKEKPIVVLSDINSVSCAELATMLIKNLPNGIFIGERTYGAVGALWPQSDSRHDLFYGGCFGDYNYYLYGKDYYRLKDDFAYYVYTSTYHTVDKNYGDIEGLGVQPDINVPFQMNSLFIREQDVQLDSAMAYLMRVAEK